MGNKYYYMEKIDRLLNSVNLIKDLRQRIEKIRWRERKISFGTANQDKTFYVIRRISNKEGHFSMFNSILGHLKEAEDRNMIPVIDMKNYFNHLWQTEEKKKRENAWEYFFRQPAGFLLKDIRGSKNIVLSNGINAPRGIPSHNDIYFQKKQIDTWYKIYIKYITLDTAVLNHINEIEDKLHLSERKVMGIAVRRGISRGHQVNNRYFSGYAKQPEVDEIIKDVKRLSVNWNCDYYFVVADDEEFISIFKEEFGENVLCVDRKRAQYFKNGRPLKTTISYIADSENKEMALYQNGIDYISEIFLLARCKSILCGKSSGTAASFIINGNQYEHVKVY